ncbi:MAG: aminotransferase class III-fold pyridoxal phosphate-dependent enzyme, partial [Ignavibacteriaceae bacterium]
LKNRLPEYLIPNYFITLDRLPLTPSGKIDRKSLPSPIVKYRKSESETNIILNETGERLRKIWNELSGVNDINLNDNFFDLGGDSLLMGRMQIRINKEFGINLSIVDLFQYSTLSSLSEFIGNKDKKVINEPIKEQSEKSTMINSDVAVIGISGRYPKAKNKKIFWENLINGIEGISFFSDDELEYSAQTNSESELKFVKARGVLEDADKFDAEFFGFKPREAVLMDPQHRIFLELAWEALEDAGYIPEKYNGAIGIFAGTGFNTYLIYNVLGSREKQEDFASSYQISDYTTLTGNDNAYLTTKIAYKLGLRGPAINIQTACSTSLVAISQAYQSLTSGQSDMVLAGGVSISFPQKRGYYFVDGSIGSADGHCKPFDADATGTVFSGGGGIVVLKRLEDAIKDGDSIYAVIKSAALNNDGSNKAGFMAPGVDGQVDVISKAQKQAGVDAESIKYVEAHGTGTPVGDPIELTALEKAFRLSTDKKEFCGVGSVKSNIGHTDAAAGVTGFIKTALSLHHGVVPPTINFKNPNPRFNFKNSPFYVVDKLTKLGEEGEKVRAAVSAFGVGGTNAHVILENYQNFKYDYDENKRKQILIVSAKTENSLNGNITALSEYLEENPTVNINDIAYTLQEGRKEFEWRQFLVADNGRDAISELRVVLKTGINKRQISNIESPQVVFMFPGQGAQYVNMGKGLYENEKVFREIVDKCAEIIKPYLEIDIRELLYPTKNNEDTASKLEQTVYTQPALFIIEYALAKLFISYDIQPSSMIGHSIGDYTAACLAGVFSLENALYIIAMRARLMQNQEPGSMLSVRLSQDKVSRFLTAEIALAANNSPNLTVLSGPTEKIKELADELTRIKIENRVLYTSHAYHSKMMEPALEPFLEEFRKITLNNPTMPFISSLTGNWITKEQARDPEFWVSQLRSTVRFSEGIEELQKNKNLILIELGPGRALTTMAGQHRNNSINQTTITTLLQPDEHNDDDKNILTAIGKSWLAGLKINWEKFHVNEKRRRVHLPSYQFDRKSYWIEPPARNKKNLEEIQRTNSLNRLELLNKTKNNEKVIKRNKMTRQENIINILKEILEELSGIKKSELNENSNFLELGFDSLFMTQVSLAFQKKFGVKITLRQLLENTPTIKAISGFIDSKLPEGKFAAPIEEVVVTDDASKNEEYEKESDYSVRRSGVATVSEDKVIEKLIYEQIEIMKRQLEVLNGRNRNRFIEKEELIDSTYVENNIKSTLSGENAQDKKEKKNEKEFERFGPYKPIDTTKSGGFTDRQQRYLNELIKRFTKKTSKSKKLTQENRPHFADPRTVAGFLPAWKEITYPIITKYSSGSKLIDVDENEYLDVTMGFGTNLFGHNPGFIREAIAEQMKKGFEIGPQSPIAGEVAKMICEFTGMERVSFCNTGSEAVLGALRAARTVTGNDKVVIFSGDYHGVNDEVLVKGNIIRGKRMSVPIAPGIPKEMVENIIVLDYGKEESLKTIKQILPDLAAVMVEPVQSRKPELQPKEFLKELRKITEEGKVPLIFDEVITGFRIHQGGAQEYFGIKADLATYGKIIGGGLPIGVIAGKSIYMDALDGGMWNYGDESIPEAGVTFFAGTFVRHPLTLAACRAVLTYLKSKGGKLQEDLNSKTTSMVSEINDFLVERNVPIRLNNFGSLFYFSHPKELQFFSLLFFYLRDHGLHIWEGRPCFLSESHSEGDIGEIVRIFKESINEMQEGGFLPEQINVSESITRTEAAKEIVKRYPLADAQKEIWAACMMSENATCAFNESARIILRGKLNQDALKKSVLKVFKKHDSLRSTFTEDGLYQVVNPNMDLKLNFSDLSSLPENERNSRFIGKINHETSIKFNLTKGPLLRAELIKLGEEEHCLIITAHHIVCDGWSYDVMVKDLSKIYSDEVEQISSDVTEPMQMEEFVSYMTDLKNTEEYKKQENYWLNQFKPTINQMELPVDFDRTKIRTFSGARITGHFHKDLLSKVKELSFKNGNTIFVTLLSGFSVLLNKLTQEEDIITGIPAAGQQVIGAHDLIGHCTNLLPIRFQIEPEIKFSDYLKKVKSLVLDAYDNQQVTYGDLITKLKVKRSSGRTPLLSTMFNVDPAIMGLKFSGLESELLVNPRSGFQFELGFNIVISADKCEVECDYNTDLFAQPTIHKFINYYNYILEQIVEDDKKLLKEIQILSSSEIINIMNILHHKNN